MPRQPEGDSTSRQTAPEPAVEPVPVGAPTQHEPIVEPPDVEAIEEYLAEPAHRPLAGDALSAAERRLGSEGLSRLRARYSEVLARISETVSDPQRQDELKTQAERLNPDTWVTDTEVTAGLESYESVFESLRTVVGRRRRRRRRSGGRHAGEGQDVRAASDSRPEDDSGTEGDEMDGLDRPAERTDEQ